VVVVKVACCRRGHNRRSDLGVVVDVEEVLYTGLRYHRPGHVIVAVPGPAPVTRPVEFTVATPAPLELHV